MKKVESVKKKPCRLSRRGAVAAQVVISLTMLCGFAALTVDVGMMYHGRTELQRSVDAAALAAAAALGDYSEGSSQTVARAAALDYANRNEVLRQGLQLNPGEDVIFGRASLDPDSGKYTFEEAEVFPNAVRIVGHRETPLYFANVFGLSSTTLSAQATAVLIPRDIVLVVDLSGSHNDDSELKFYQETDINLYDVWEALPDNGDPMSPGPTFGYMDTWGTDPITDSYNPTADPGLIKLQYHSNWSDSALQSRLLAAGYSSSEVNAIKSKSYDSNGAWPNRVAAALGLAIWRSGKSGGLWQSLGMPPGNGNNWVGSSELTWQVDYPYGGGSWSGYFDYVKSSSTAMEDANSNFRYRFGLKTFVNYLLERRPSNAQTPELADTPHQPMQAVKDASTYLVNVVEGLESGDLIGLAGYGTYGYGPDEKPDDMSWLTDNFSSLRTRLAGLQAGHWTSYTNIAQGIDEGRALVMDTSHEARSNAAKVMILLTDGIANRTRYSAAYDTYQARQDAKSAAADAREDGIQIYTVSVGVGADQDLMQEIAGIGEGDWFHAEGSIETYSAQLDAIFEHLGGERPVILID